MAFTKQQKIVPTTKHLPNLRCFSIIVLQPHFWGLILCLFVFIKQWQSASSLFKGPHLVAEVDLRHRQVCDRNQPEACDVSQTGESGEQCSKPVSWRANEQPWIFPFFLIFSYLHDEGWEENPEITVIHPIVFVSLKNLLGAIWQQPISGWMERGVPRKWMMWAGRFFFVFHVLGVIFPANSDEWSQGIACIGI